MRYFQEFPKTSYRMSEAANGAFSEITRTVPNMTVKLVLDIREDKNTPYETYRVVDSDRPDTVATKLYGAARYAWVILLANNMRDLYDWPLGDKEFVAYLNSKYETSVGANNGYIASKSIIYKYIWNKPDGQILEIDQTAYASLPPDEVSAIDACTYETDENNKRRLIRVPTLESLPGIIRQFDAAMAK